MACAGTTMTARVGPRRVPHFEIWQAGDRIVSIEDPTRQAILRILETGPTTLPRLAAALGRAKSTLSENHLTPLRDQGIVLEAQDAKDARRKWFRLAGQRLGSSDVEKERLREAVLRYARGAGADPIGRVLDVLDLRDLVRRGDPAYLRALAKRLGRLLRGAVATEGPGRRAGVEALLKAHGLDPSERSGLGAFLAQVLAEAS